MKLTEDDIRAKLAKEYKPTQPEFPRHARHYFKVPLPEDLRSKQVTCPGFVDTLTLENGQIQVQEYGAIFDNTWIQPVWLPYTLIELHLKEIMHPGAENEFILPTENLTMK